MIMTFNPIDSNHWLKGKVEDELVTNKLVIHTTFRDNVFIDDEYRDVLDIKARTNRNYGRIYREGEWGIAEVDRPFMYAYTEQLVDDTIELDPKQTVYVSFDFNINPMTATVHQYRYMKYYYTLYEFKAANTGVGQFVDMILNSKLAGCHFVVTGDASGRARSATGGNRNNYDIIRNKMRLMGRQLNVPTKNPALSESRTLSNQILSLYPDRKIHPRCEHLLNDLRYVEADDKDKPKPPDPKMGHLLDTVRYMDNTFMRNFIKDSRAMMAARRKAMSEAE